MTALAKLTNEDGGLAVTVFPYRAGFCYGNIMWQKAHPMRAGKFPLSHPVGGVFADQAGNGPQIVLFRERGYWASCFPEGDGITWKPLRDQSDEQCMADIRACFPSWSARWNEEAIRERAK